MNVPNYTIAITGGDIQNMNQYTNVDAEAEKFS